MFTEALVSLVIAVLGFIFNEVKAHKEKVATDGDLKKQELRKAVTEATPENSINSNVSGVLDEQHDRVQQALRDS